MIKETVGFLAPLRPALALLTVFTLSGPAYAVPTWDNVWRKVTMLYPEDGGVTFYVDGTPEPNPSGTCEKNRLIVKVTDANYDAKVSAILTAYSLGAPGSHQLLVRNARSMRFGGRPVLYAAMNGVLMTTSSIRRLALGRSRLGCHRPIAATGGGRSCTL